MMADLLYHLMNIDRQQLAHLFSYDKDLDKFSSGAAAVYDTLDSSTTRRGAPVEWSTGDIPEKIFYYYCFALYPASDYKKWVTAAQAALRLKDSVAKLCALDIDDLFANFEDSRESLVGRQAMEAIGYKCLHHSQAFSVLAALQQVRSKALEI